MQFPSNRRVDRIQVPIVSICNRTCSHCCAKEKLTWYNKAISEKEISIEKLRGVGQIIGPISRIEITGGEPTLHSKFEELSNNLTEIFQCNDFMLVTNGWLFGKDPSKLPLLLKYQRVWITHYTEKFVLKYGGVMNTIEVERIVKFLQAAQHPAFKVEVTDSHVPYADSYGGLPCGHYWSDMIAYYQGDLYGCCVAWSLPFQGKSIPLTPAWREHLTELELPCEQCPISWRKQ